MRDNVGKLSTLTANISGAHRYQQAIYGVINGNSSPVEQNKFCELWSTNKKVIGAHVDLP